MTGPYAEHYREHPQPGTEIGKGRYVCLKTPGFLARVIRWSTHSQYNHVIVTGPDGQIVEATPRGVRVGKLGEYAGMMACANLHERMTLAQEDEAWAAAVAMVNDPYNWPDILEIGLGDLGWHWKALIRLCGADRAFICSQLAALAGKAAGLDWDCGTLGPNDDQVTPAMMARRPGTIPVVIR